MHAHISKLRVRVREGSEVRQKRFRWVETRTGMLAANCGRLCYAFTPLPRTKPDPDDEDVCLVLTKAR